MPPSTGLLKPSCTDIIVLAAQDIRAVEGAVISAQGRLDAAINRRGVQDGRIPNKVDESIDELDPLPDQFSGFQPGIWLEGDDGLGAFGLAVPAIPVVA